MISLTNKTPAYYIAAIVTILMATGAIFVFSAGANINQQLDLQHFYRFTQLRQILFFPLAVCVMHLVSRVNYKLLSLEKGFYKSPAVYLLVLSIALLIIVLIPGLGTEINYARRWLKIPLGHVKISFQPSELAKWTVIIFLAAFCHKFHDSLKLYWKRFIPLCVIAASVILLILIEDFGTAALIGLLTVVMLIIAGASLWHMLTPLPFGLAAFLMAILSSETRKSRILAFLHPEKWTDSINYQPSQSLIAIGSGGLWGKGLGRGICKYGHLPEDTTDFIFAIIGEELGFFGCAAVIILFIAFVWLGIYVITNCKDPFGRLLAAGIILTIAIQAALNIGVVTVVLPTKGIPLPFVSAGGTSMLLSAAAVGVLLNIAQQTQKTQIPEIE
ncbi:putative lipid II flippase FtsW [Planctomycetota bacterium]